jgi:hypothetical protein
LQRLVNLRNVGGTESVGINRHETADERAVRGRVRAVVAKDSVDHHTIWKWRKGGLLAGYFVDSSWRISAQELEAFKRHCSVRRSKNRPSFREFAASTLGCNRVTLWSIEKRIGKKVTAEVLADLLKEEGRRQGRQEMYRELCSRGV